MKTCIGLFILMVLLVAACGCTVRQATASTPTVPATTPIPATPVETLPQTPAATETPAPPTVAGTIPVILATPAPEETARVTPVATTMQSSVQQPSTTVTTIHIRNNSYVPSQLIVLPGTRVTWINDDPGTHIVKSTGDAAGKFTSAELINGAQFGYTFGEATGTFEFTDPKFPDMKGTIIVKLGQTLWIATFAPNQTPV